MDTPNSKGLCCAQRQRDRGRAADLAAIEKLHQQDIGATLSRDLRHDSLLSLTRLADEAMERLDEIVTKALAKDREERYQVAKVLVDLRRLKQPSLT